MKKLVQINFRATVALDDKIVSYADSVKITKSDLIYKALEYYLQNKGYDKLKKQVENQTQIEVIRENNHSFYLIKNAFMNIIKISKMSILLTGDIEYNKIDHMIKSYVKLYNTFPAKIKKLMKREIECLQLLKYKKYLMQYMNEWDLVKEFILETSKTTKRIEFKK